MGAALRKYVVGRRLDIVCWAATFGAEFRIGFRLGVRRVPEGSGSLFETFLTLAFAWEVLPAFLFEFLFIVWDSR